MLRFLALLLVLWLTALPAGAQALAPTETLSPLQTLLQQNREGIEKPARRTVEATVEALLASDLDGVRPFLEAWRARDIWQRKTDGLFFAVRAEGDALVLIDPATGSEAGRAAKADMVQIKPNSGVQSVIDAALVRFQLSDPDAERRAAALAAIERDPSQTHLEPLRAAIADETDATLKDRKVRLERLLTIRFATDENERAAAIESFAGSTSVDVRSALNPILATTRTVAPTLPETGNVARRLVIGTDLTQEEAYRMLVDANLAPPRIADAERNAVLIANIRDGMVGGLPVADLTTDEARDVAYQGLVDAGLASPFTNAAGRAELVASHVFFETYNEPSAVVTGAASDTLQAINRAVGMNRFFDLALDALSLASIYFLAAIGLAITFGVMGVINMAHGEFIMMGAYTGYVVQQWISDYTVSILVAIPLAFAVTFAAGVAMERLVIRHLMHRPLETLLATFGISIALQQIAKNIFGTQARPLTAPGWLDGSLVINDIVQISYIRVAIFVLAAIFLALLLFILKRTRLGLEVRAVTQNRRMAAAMGINPDRINMLTFGLGSGIAGIAGVAIGLFAQVTSEIGTNYIVQSFMTVVVGGVGNIWGTLAGAGMIGSFQKVIEFFNPSNTLAAQTYMIIFIIIFIQFRPKGIIALKGRAAGD